MRYLVVFCLTLLSFGVSAQCLEGDCENGVGKYSCDCGYVYEGEFVNGQKFKGTLTKKDLVYTGQFKNDVASGYGKMTYKDGASFEGTFVDNTPHGYGTYNFGNGHVYVGEINMGSFHGLGIQIIRDLNGEVIETLIGTFENDLMHGMGCSINFNKDLYIGMFSKNQFMGYGLYLFNDSQELEAGIFRKRKLKNKISSSIPASSGKFEVNVSDTDSTSFKASGNLDGTHILLSQRQMGDPLVKVFFDVKLQLFFVQTLSDAGKGLVINFMGEIFEAELLEGERNEIRFLKQLYLPKE